MGREDRAQQKVGAHKIYAGGDVGRDACGERGARGGEGKCNAHRREGQTVLGLHAVLDARRNLAGTVAAAQLRAALVAQDIQLCRLGAWGEAVDCMWAKTTSGTQHEEIIRTVLSALTAVSARACRENVTQPEL